jgi:hypothetical protein
MNEIALTVREKQQLLSVLRDLDPEAPSEKRQNPRRKVRLNLEIRAFSAGSSPIPVRAGLINVSPEGAGLIVSETLEVGNRLLLPLRFREGGGWLVLAEVRNCARLSHGQFKVGCLFREKIEDPDSNAQPPGDWLV